MKLLGWMHRKLRQNSIQPLKNLTIAHPQLDEQQYYPEPTYHSANSRQTRTCQKSSIGLKANRVEENFEEEASTMVHELFHGFLAIGTLGAESFIMEPTTPKLTTSFGNVTEKETEVTESDLKLINNQLGQFLEAEAKEIGNESPERSSRASIITLSSKKIEGVDAEEHGNMVACPLQEYLFGSSLELPDIPADVKREKASLGELFEKHSIAHKHDTEKIHEGLEANGIHFMKKILKKLHFSSRKSTTSICGNATNSGSTKRKVPKIKEKLVNVAMSKSLKKSYRQLPECSASSPKGYPLRGIQVAVHSLRLLQPEYPYCDGLQKLSAKKSSRKSSFCQLLRGFHRKIHPETAETKAKKSQKYETNTSNNGGYHNEDVAFEYNNKTMCLHTTMLNNRTASFRMSPSLSSSQSIGNRECWITTDADFLVLEL